MRDTADKLDTRFKRLLQPSFLREVQLTLNQITGLRTNATLRPLSPVWRGGSVFIVAT